MKITKITTYIVTPRWLFLKIETDEGIFGWGEPVVEGRAHTVAAAVDELSDYLIGQDPLQIEKHWQAMYRGAFYRGGPILMSAIAGVDQALGHQGQVSQCTRAPTARRPSQGSHTGLRLGRRRQTRRHSCICKGGDRRRFQSHQNERYGGNANCRHQGHR
jgi:hypothetical protein